VSRKKQRDRLPLQSQR